MHMDDDLFRDDFPDFEEMKRQANINAWVEMGVYMLGVATLTLFSYAVGTFTPAVPV